jgi:hypothetical protein
MQYYVAELFTGDLNVRFTAGAYLREQPRGPSAWWGYSMKRRTYHLYLTNIGQEKISTKDVALLYSDCAGVSN